MSLWKVIEPEGVYVDFMNVVPGFARTNTPKKEWTGKQRMRRLSNGKPYELPPYGEMKGHFVLLHDWSIECRFSKGETRKYMIPELQTTDFASIPKLLHSLISPLSNSVYSAVLHDYLYRSPKDEVAKRTTRKEADRMFYFGMKACGVSRPLALFMYWGVRLGGGSSYKGRH